MARRSPSASTSVAPRNSRRVAERRRGRFGPPEDAEQPCLFQTCNDAGVYPFSSGGSSTWRTFGVDFPGRSPSPEAVFSSGFLHLDNMKFGIISGLASTSKNETTIQISGYFGIRQKIMQPKNQFGNFSHHEMNREWEISKNAGRSH
ncbi:hypothetical protein [Burkholderia gladioli]|uniref:hypothetical protein n=1 Tax=Burkholderia gladioli TaxID=28095 RepID=UPI0015E669C8|nr:hypothetical protein [Burkholderia gladioli]MBA1363827.1 hypothetical protein [Burkholderia gladioli]